MRLPFSKMQGAGNDFVVIDAFSSPVRLSSEQIRQICDRRFGVGCDQLLMLAKPENPGFDSPRRSKPLNSFRGRMRRRVFLR